MTVTSRRMRRGTRTITQGKQLLGQRHGLGTHVGPNALLRSASYPAITSLPVQAGGASGPLTAVPFTANSGGALVIDGTQETASGGICTNWGSLSQVYVYNNNPSNLGGIVPSGGMVIDGFAVPGNAYVFQFMDVSWNGVSLSSPARDVVFRGCRGRGTTVPATGFFNTGDETYASQIFFMYCDVGGSGGGSDGPAAGCIKMQHCGGFTAYRCYLSDAATMLQPVTSADQIDIFECFIEGMAYLNYGTGDQTHLNGITFNGDQTNCRIVRNNIVAGVTDINGHTIVDTDCISFFQDVVGGVTPYYPGTGTNPDGTTGYQVIGNYLGGTGYCLYLANGAGGAISHFLVLNNLVTASTWPVGVTTDGASGTGGGWNGPVTNEPTWDAVSGSQVGNHQAGNLWADGTHAGLTFM